MTETFRHLDDNDRVWQVPVGMTPTNTGTCRGCGQTVLWVITASGKKMPLNNVTPSSHFANCPNADSFRKGGNQPPMFDGIL